VTPNFLEHKNRTKTFRLVSGNKRFYLSIPKDTTQLHKKMEIRRSKKIEAARLFYENARLRCKESLKNKTKNKTLSIKLIFCETLIFGKKSFKET